MLGDLYRVVRQQLSSISEHGDIEARRIIQYRTNMDWGDIAAFPERKVASSSLILISDDISERLTGKPLSKIHGVKEFYGFDFYVSEDVLDPRPDTEIIVDIAVDKYKTYSPKRILDLGTGTGCLIITLLKLFPDAHGMAVDISSKALDIAGKNAEKYAVSERLTFIKSDWWDDIPENQKFDLIISNPPYIREDVIPDLMPEVKKYDPILSLNGGKDGLQAYKQIFSQLFSYMNKDATALFEIGYDQGDDMTRLSKESGFTVNTLHRDLAGQPRVVQITCGDK